MMNCKNCNKKYEIHKIEKQIRNDIGVEDPHLCPRCRLENKYSQISDYKFISLNCSVCGQRVVTANPMSKFRPVACKKCYITTVLDKQNSDS